MFIEFGGVKQSAPQESIFANVLPEPLPDVDRVVGYLRAGHVLIDFMDVRDDVFDPSRQILGGPTTLTDGEWFWRDDLAHYVSRHNVRLPNEFLQAIRDRQYAVPELDEATLAERADEAVRLMS
jgi:hypothetical protein